MNTINAHNLQEMRDKLKREKAHKVVGNDFAKQEHAQSVAKLEAEIAQAEKASK